MEPTIVEKSQITLVGFSFFGDPFQASAEWTEENEIGRLWKRFITYLMNNPDRIKHVKADRVSYEVQIEHEETASKGNFQVFVGVEVEKLEDVPLELVVKILPPTRYAVFTLHGAQITSDWPLMIYGEWLPSSGYQAAFNYHFQYYDQRFKGLENLDESVVEIYVPIK